MSSSSHVFTSAADGIREGSKRAADAFTTAMGTDTGAFTDVVDGCRYWSGLFCVVVTFCVHVPYLLSMHTFVSLWRRLGRVPTVLAHVGLSSALVSRVSSSPPVREAIMNAFGGDLGFPTRYACVAAGLLVVASIWLRIQWMRDMDLATATGWVGELERGGRGGKLHTSGVYAIVRHPRYAQILVGTAAIALFSNHGVVWFTLAAAAVILTIVTGLEERELGHRFGAAHAEYVAAVPNLFFPFPFFPLPPSLRAKYDADTAGDERSDVDADVDAVDAITKAMLRAAESEVEKAFADDDTEDAVPTATIFPHDTTISRSVADAGASAGSNAVRSPPSTPDPYAFREQDEERRQQQQQQQRQRQRQRQNVEGALAAANIMEVDDDDANDAAAMFPDADELMSAMITGSDAAVPSPSKMASARARAKKTE